MHVKRFASAEGQLEQAIEGIDPGIVLAVVTDGPGAVLVFTSSPLDEAPKKRARPGSKETR